MSAAVSARGASRAGSMPLKARVHAELSRGGFHSGADLARRLGVSRSAIWKAVVALREIGVSVHAVRNRGYRLPVACEPLDGEKIREALASAVSRRVRRIEAVWSLGSTNAVLLERAGPPPGAADVLLAEHQTAGRGRQGRSWLASPGAALCLSLAWSFAQVPRDLGALGLAVGVWILRALERRTATPIRLKWPNDLTVEDRKLAGILIEMRAESGGPTRVVIGVGINLALGAAVVAEITAAGTRATDLKSAGADPTPRNAISAELVAGLVRGLERFEREGLRPWLEQWKAADSLHGRLVSVRGATARTRGVARGIDASGALVLETREGIRRFVSGEVSVRADP
jgi:BirA family transcriptional regulator, biotin operon repressor / biotin---[acetyl-CoA-carboxylase] ligase